MASSTVFSSVTGPAPAIPGDMLVAAAAATAAEDEASIAGTDMADAVAEVAAAAGAVTGVAAVVDDVAAPTSVPEGALHAVSNATMPMASRHCFMPNFLWSNRGNADIAADDILLTMADDQGRHASNPPRLPPIAAEGKSTATLEGISPNPVKHVAGPTRQHCGDWLIRYHVLGSLTGVLPSTSCQPAASL